MNDLIDTIKKYYDDLYYQFMQQSKKTTLFCTLFVLTLLNSGSVVVSWDANKENDLAGYKIYYGTTSKDYKQNVYVGNQTSYRISDLEEGQHYYFAVTAIDLAGNESPYSEEVSTFIPEQTKDEAPNSNQFLGPRLYNFPNPFKILRESTSIRYKLLNSAQITIEIWDLNNKLVKTLIKNEFKTEGEHTEDLWDGTNSKGEFVANGVYYGRIQTTGVQRFIKIAVIR